MPKHRFIKQAIKRPGALTKKAQDAGQSISTFASAHQHEGTRTGAQARFYLRVLKPAIRHRVKSAELRRG